MASVRFRLGSVGESHAAARANRTSPAAAPEKNDAFCRLAPLDMTTPPAGSRSQKRSDSRHAPSLFAFAGRPRKHGTEREPHVRSRINAFARIVRHIFGSAFMQTPPPRELILEQLERMLASNTFTGAERSRVLLRFLVEHVVENQPDRLKDRPSDPRHWGEATRSIRGPIRSSARKRRGSGLAWSGTTGRRDAPTP